jgi:hypothetical protein
LAAENKTNVLEDAHDFLKKELESAKESLISYS